MIINLFKEHSDEAVPNLKQKYGKLCNTLSFDILQDEEATEECVKDIFTKVQEVIPELETDSLPASLCRITREMSLKKYKTNRENVKNPIFFVIAGEMNRWIRDKENVEDRLTVSEMAECINEALEMMKEEERAVFMHRYWFCKSYDELQVDLGMNMKKIGQYLDQSMEKIRKCLAERGYQ